MATLVNIVSTALKKIKGAPGKSLNAKTEGIGGTSAEMELYSVPGIYGRPIKDSKGIAIRVGGLNIIIATHNYKIDENINDGDTLIYSMDDDGALAATVYMKANGEIVINEGTDYGVKYNELEEAFNELKDDFNALVQKWNTFAYAYKPGGPSAAGLPASASQTDESGADISSAKVEKVRI